MPGLHSSCFYVLSHLDNQKEKTCSIASCGHGAPFPNGYGRESRWSMPHFAPGSSGVTPVSITVSLVCWLPSPRTRPWYLMCKPRFCSVVDAQASEQGHSRDGGEALIPSPLLRERPAPSAVPAVSFWSQISGSLLYLIS